MIKNVMTFSGLTGRQKTYLLFGAAYAIASILLFVVVRLGDVPSSVYDGYFPYADAMARGVLPYSEEVFVYGHWNVWEYPPLTYVFLFIPRLIGWTPASYQATYIAMTFVIFVIGLYYTERIAKDLNKNPFRVMLLYTFLMMIMFEYLVDRFDIIPTVLLIVVLSLAIRKRYEAAFVLLAAGTLLKLFPAFVFPVLLIYMISIREYRRVGLSVVFLTSVAGVIVGLLGSLGTDPFSFLGYHTDRPLEIESLMASVILFLNLFVNLDISLEFSFGSDNVVGALPDSIAPVMLWIAGGLMLACCFVYAYYAFRRRTEDLHDASLAMILILLSFLLFSTVFSGQYMVWAIPLILFCLMFVKNRTYSAFILIIFVVAEVLTQLNFALNFGLRPEGTDLYALGIIAVLLRNILLIYLFGIFACLLAGKNPPIPRKAAEYINSKIPE